MHTLIKTLATITLVSLASQSLPAAPLFDLPAIRDTSTLDTKIIQDWQPNAKDPAFQQKLIEITVCHWWPGQPVRLPVTLLAPTNPAQLPCKNILVANMGLTLKPAAPKDPALSLLKNEGVGIVLVGMSTIDAMKPAGQLHLGMKEQLLETKNPRYTPAWIWGMSQMRGLTAAAADSQFFQPKKVVATGGSKRGIATAVAGIHDDRFTAIMPVVAPPLGNPGAPSTVMGTEPKWISDTNQAFLYQATPAVRQSLEARNARRAANRLTLQETIDAAWTDADRAAITDRAWDASRITNHLPALQKRGLKIFYNVGSNDSVTPALRQLGRDFPNFPLYIVPGGQHGGPADAGFSRRVPTLPQVQQNLDTFCRHHFFNARPLINPPTITVTRPSKHGFTVTATFPEGITPEKNELAWSTNRHQPYTLPFEYDAWESIPMTPSGDNTWTADFTTAQDAESISILTTHTHTQNKLPLTLSSPLQHFEK